MAVVYVLWHVHTVNDRDNEKLVGVYRSEKDAKAAIERLKNKPGFKEKQDGFVGLPTNLDSQGLFF